VLLDHKIPNANASMLALHFTRDFESSRAQVRVRLPSVPSFQILAWVSSSTVPNLYHFLTHSGNLPAVFALTFVFLYFVIVALAIRVFEPQPVLVAQYNPPKGASPAVAAWLLERGALPRGPGRRHRQHGRERLPENRAERRAREENSDPRTRPLRMNRR